MMVWLSIWSLGCAALSFSVFNAWQSKNKLAAIPLTLFSIPFLAGWFFGLWMLMQFASPWVCEIYVSGPSAAGLVLPLAIASSFSSSFTSAISSASTAPGSSSGSGGGGSSGGGGGGGW